MKSYTFECTMKSKGFGTVTAASKKEAFEKIINGEYDDIIDETDRKVVSVNEESIKEDA